VLTLFTVPKAFVGHIDTIQRNAIRSWQLLEPKCEVILAGDDPGAAEVAKEFGLRHISGFAQNAFGTPLVNAAFAEAERMAAHATLCYLNTDIILMSDFLPAVRSAVAKEPKALLVGRRWDIDIRTPLDFGNGWEVQLRCLLSEKGRLHAHTGIDYFVFPRGLWREIPKFGIGRGAWDNWLVYQAKSQGGAIVDLTQVVSVVHQNHDYRHVTGISPSSYSGEEAAQNLALAGGYSHLFTIADANYVLTRNGIRRKWTPFFLYRLLVTWSASHRSALWILKAIRSLLVLIRGEKDSFALE